MPQFIVSLGYRSPFFKKVLILRCYPAYPPPRTAVPAVFSPHFLFKKIRKGMLIGSME